MDVRTPADIESLLSGCEPKDEFDKLLILIEEHLHASEQSAEIVTSCWQRIIGGQLWTTQYNTVESFEMAVGYSQIIEPVVKLWNDTSRRKNLYLQTIEKRWDRSLVDILTSNQMPATPSRYFLSQMAALSEITSVDQALCLLEKARSVRVRWKSVASVTGSDIIWAIQHANATVSEARSNVKKDDFRSLLASHDTLILNTPSTTPTTRIDTPQFELLSDGTNDTVEGTVRAENFSEKRSSEVRGKSDEHTILEDASQGNDVVEEGYEDCGSMEEDTKEGEGEDDDVMEEKTPESEDIAEPRPLPQRKPIQGQRRPRSKWLSGTGECKCGREVKPLIAKLPAKLNHRLSNKNGVEVLTSAYRNGLSKVCWRHLRNIAKMTVGLKSSGDKNNRKELEFRIKSVALAGLNFDGVRHCHFDWFIKDQQTNEVRQRLGSARYSRRERYEFMVDPKVVWKRFASLDALREFEEHGTVNVPGIFDFLLKDPEISRYIDEEFEMYRHHWYLRGASGPNLGWLRNMWYSIIQQAVRQNPVYYALLASARPDRNHWLISYPYYVKDTVSGEKTGFHHLDLNARQCVEFGKGRNIVQGALALDDENEENCTVVVKGFHREINQWYQRIQERKQEIPNGETTDLKILYTAADKEEFGDYEPVPCNAGEVRITLSTIPHGSTTKANSNRRVIIPWWTGIRPDHFTLDNEESENYDEVAICHLHRARCKKSPSGRTAKAYLSGVPFEATVDLPFSSYIGDALVGKRKWNTAPVERQCAIIFGKNDLDARLEVGKIQRVTIDAYKAAFKQLRIEEEMQYGEVSFFKWWYGGGKEGLLPRPKADGVCAREPSLDELSARQSDTEYEYSEEDDDGGN